MICIKCSTETRVINSRSYKKTPGVWRRRSCPSCGAVFTTSEVVADDGYLFLVRSEGRAKAQPFSLARLMMSMAPALAHHGSHQAADESFWLAKTVAQTAQATAVDVIEAASLAQMAFETLSNYDASAGIIYGAKRGIVRNSSQKPRRGRPRLSRP